MNELTTPQPRTDWFHAVYAFLFVILLMTVGSVVLPTPAYAHHAEDHDGGANTAICHIAGPEQARIIFVNESALEAHLAHGDYQVDLEFTGRKAGQFCAAINPDVPEVPDVPVVGNPDPDLPVVDDGPVPAPAVPQVPHADCVTPDGFPFQTDPGPCPEPIVPEPVVSSAALEAPAPTPLTQLPRTGFGSLLAGLGAGLIPLGLGIRRIAR